MIDRKELKKFAGQMVIVWYAEDDCFVIGWFFAMDQLSVDLKVTSTRYDTYESRTIQIESITGIAQYEMN